jgi:hypothetical protein
MRIVFEEDDVVHSNYAASVVLLSKVIIGGGTLPAPSLFVKFYV